MAMGTETENRPSEASHGVYLCGGIMRRRKLRLAYPKIQIPGLVPFKPRFELSCRPPEFTAVFRDAPTDRPETTFAIRHRDNQGKHPAIPNRPTVLHRQTPQAFAAVTRLPIRRRGPEVQLGVITTDDRGMLALGIRDRNGETALAFQTPALATTPIARSRLGLTAVGASIGAHEGLGGMIVGGLAGYGFHLLLEELVG